MKLRRTLFAMAGATVLLGALVATASAGRLSSSSQTLRATFSRVDFGGGFGTSECPLTLEGSFHSKTLAKVAGSLTGYITRAIVGTCIRGSGTILTATLPWHVRYVSFAGTLPAIQRINAQISGVNFNIREPTFGVSCLASNASMNVAFTREASGALTSAAVEGPNIETSCGIRGTLSGTSTAFTVLGSGGRITVTLI
jgi:hypothetical protein